VLKHRLIFGPILIVLLLAMIWFDDRLGAMKVEGWWTNVFPGRETFPPGLILYVIGMIVAPLAARELTAIFAAQGIRTRTWLTALAAMIGLTASYAVPASTQAVASSPPRPNTKGSPPLRRTTRWPARPRSTIRRLMSSCERVGESWPRFPTLMHSAVAGA